MTEEGYSAPTEQTQYKANKRRCGRPLKLNETLSQFIQYYLKLHWSQNRLWGAYFQIKFLSNPSIDGLTLTY
ncbi:hypothetical protein STAR110904_00230 [Staphylococcus argensis]